MGQPDDKQEDEDDDEERELKRWNEWLHQAAHKVESFCSKLGL